METHENCPRFLYRMWIDPVDQIVRELVCAHGDVKLEHPKQIMIVWPDGKTNVWPEKQTEAN